MSTTTVRMIEVVRESTSEAVIEVAATNDMVAFVASNGDLVLLHEPAAIDLVRSSLAEFGVAYIESEEN